jgi:hypothetical protein
MEANEAVGNEMGDAISEQGTKTFDCSYIEGTGRYT